MTVVKAADDKQPTLDALRALLERPDVEARTRRRIEQEFRTTSAGNRGEADAAYEIDFHLAERKAYAIIHDLRIEFEGRVAQIDHLLLNRGLDLWVCESKSFKEGVRINEYGEWARYHHGRVVGMASPVEQNRKHVAVLQGLFDKGPIRLPKRVGVVTLKPNLLSIILVSNDARIDRPRSKRAAAAVDGLDTVIKVEQLLKTLERRIDERNAFGLLAKLVGHDTIIDIANQLVALHKPAAVDWGKRFGLSPDAPVNGDAEAMAPASTPATSQSATPGAPCDNCGRPISQREAEYLGANPGRFAGAVLCYRCQRSRHERRVATGRPT
jgi:hypothetical protein